MTRDERLDRLQTDLAATQEALEAEADRLLKEFEASDAAEGKSLREHGILTADAEDKIKRREVYGVREPSPAHRRL